MSMKKSLLKTAAILVLGCATLSLSGCAEMMKGISGAASGLMTEKTASLALASVQANYVTNLYPLETKEVGAEILGELWKPGQNALMVMFLKHRGIGFFEIDGSVGWRPVGSNAALQPLKYITSGSYVAVLDAGDISPKEVVITTSTGQTMSFVVAPTTKVGIKSINGKKAGAEINLDQDLNLELDLPKGKVGQVRVSLLSTVMTNRAFVDIGVFSAKTKLVIPAAAFRNLSVSASAENFVGIDTGANYLRVEHFEPKGMETLKQKNAAAFINLGLSWDSLPVSVSGQARDISKIEISGDMPLANGQKMKYSAFKSNAFYSPPLSAGKNFALASLSVEGSLYEQKTTTSESSSGNYRVITTTTITKEFPQLPDSHWDTLLQTLATDLGALLKKYNIQTLATEKVVPSKAYQELEEPEDTNSFRFIRRSHKGSKYLIARSFGKLVESTSSTFAWDRPSSRLMRETGTDGLVSLGLNVQVATDQNDKIILIPVLNFRIEGPPNGYIVGPTLYAQGSVQGTGVPFSKAELSNPNAVARVVQEKELIAGLQKALDDLENKAKTAGYQAIWALH